MLAGGCASQDFQVIAADRADSSFESSARVVDVTIRSVQRIEQVDLVFGESRDKIVVLDVERVLKGSSSPSVLYLRNLRDLTASERALFPHNVGLVPGVRMRLQYDPTTGKDLGNLRIVPLGLTKEIEDALATSRPTTGPVKDIGVPSTSAPTSRGNPH